MFRDYFRRHMWPRIALQLLLDASPVLLLACAGAALWCTYDGEPQWQTALITAALGAFVFLTVPLFIVSVLTGRRLAEFEVCPFWGGVSLALRWIGVIPMLLAGAIDVFAIAVAMDVAIQHDIPIVSIVLNILF